MKIAVSGSSGHLGKTVLALLQKTVSASQLVGLSRTPESVAPPIEGRVADFDRPETLPAAFAGIDRLFLIPSADLRPGVRGTQVTAAIEAAVAARVGHIYLLSATGTRAKAEPDIGAAYWVAEQRLIRSAAPSWTILRMSYFAETLAQEAQMSLAGGMLVGLSESQVAYVSRDDVAAAVSGCLAGDGHEGAIYNLTGPARVSGAERAQLIGKITGKPMQFVVLDAEQMKAGLAQANMPDFLVGAVTTMQMAISAGAYDIVTGDVRKLSGKEPQSLEQVLRRELG